MRSAPMSDAAPISPHAATPARRERPGEATPARAGGLDPPAGSGRTARRRHAAARDRLRASRTSSKIANALATRPRPRGRHAAGQYRGYPEAHGASHRRRQGTAGRPVGVRARQGVAAAPGVDVVGAGRIEMQTVARSHRPPMLLAVEPHALASAPSRPRPRSGCASVASRLRPRIRVAHVLRRQQPQQIPRSCTARVALTAWRACGAPPPASHLGARAG